MKSFLSGRQHVSSFSLQPLKGTPAPGADSMPTQQQVGHAPGDHGGASVECIKQGDKVVRLVVTCSCGERIEIDCLYPAGG